MISEDEEHFGRSEIVLENKPVVVEKVHITGLKRTKADFVLDDVKPVFKAVTFIEAYAKALVCKETLMAKGIFKDVKIMIDTTDAYKSGLPNGIQVIFKASEKRVIGGEVRTEMSNTEKPRWVMRIVSPNIFGRGETISTSISRSLSSVSGSQIYQPNEFYSSFAKPIGKGKTYGTFLTEKQSCDWSSFNLTTRGIEAGLSFPFLGNEHQISWQGHWRELLSSKTSSFAVRQQMGHSLKSSLNHTMVIDKTDDHLLPTSGAYFKMNEELAGLGGDVKYMKETIEGKLAATLLKKITFSLGFNAGFMLGYSNKPLLINDKFFIGGPLTLRGFQNNSVGNQDVGDYLGSTSFWIAGCHIYTPMPFYWSKFGSGSWLDNFRIHGFVNAGNSVNIDTMESFKFNCTKLADNIRLSCGFGLVYKFMQAARLELNFCFPLRAAKSDKLCDGIQFGIGLSSV